MFCIKCGRTEDAMHLFGGSNCPGGAEKTHDVDGRNCNGMDNCKVHSGK